MIQGSKFKIQNLLAASILFVILWSAQVSAQNLTTFNSGGTAQKHYYSVVPYEAVNNLMIIPVTIKGKTYRFLFDTGAVTAISESLFKELNLSTASKISTTDQSGRADSLQVVFLPAVCIDSLRFTGIPAVVMPQTILIDCFKADGLLGSNLLRNSIVRFSSPDKTITITDNPKRLDLKSKKKQSVKIFFTDVQSNPHLRIKVKSRKNFSIPVLFDSGMQWLFEIALRNCGELRKFDDSYTISGEAEGSNTFGLYGRAGDTVQYRFTVPELKINKAVLRNAVITTTANADSRIGAGLLRHGAVTVDYINKRFYFEPFFTGEKDVYEKLVPISLSMNDDRHVIVGSVWDSELKKQISTGDKVMAIDDRDMENMPYCDFFTTDDFFEKDSSLVTLKKADGSIYKVVIDKK